MTEETREILLTKMLGSPESLSDKEVLAIMGDAELRELYELSVGMRDALAPEVAIDTAREWRMLRPRLKPKRRFPMTRVTAVAAVVAGLAIIIGVIGNLFNDISLANSSDRMADAGIDTVAVKNGHQLQSKQLMSASGDAVVAETARETDSAIPHPEPAPAQTFTERQRRIARSDEVEIDIDEYLRIKQAQIDNDVAMALAAVHAEESEAIEDAIRSLNLVDPQGSLSATYAPDNGEENVINCILI